MGLGGHLSISSRVLAAVGVGNRTPAAKRPPRRPGARAALERGMGPTAAKAGYGAIARRTPVRGSKNDRPSEFRVGHMNRRILRPAHREMVSLSGDAFQNCIGDYLKAIYGEDFERIRAVGPYGKHPDSPVSPIHSGKKLAETFMMLRSRCHSTRARSLRRGASIQATRVPRAPRGSILRRLSGSLRFNRTTSSPGS